MPDEDEVAEVARRDEGRRRGDGVGVPDVAVDVAATLAGERRSVHVVPGRAELLRDAVPAAAVVPGTVDENEVHGIGNLPPR